MGIIKIPTDRCPQGEWAQVSQLFGSATKGTKLTQQINIIFGSEKGRIEAVRELTKVTNAGYAPLLDTFNMFKDEPGRVIPIDIDSIVYPGKNPPKELAKWLLEKIREIKNLGFASEKERGKLIEAALQTANPKMKKALLRELNEKN